MLSSLFGGLRGNYVVFIVWWFKGLLGCFHCLVV